MVLNFEKADYCITMISRLMYSFNSYHSSYLISLLLNHLQRCESNRQRRTKTSHSTETSTPGICTRVLSKCDGDV